MFTANDIQRLRSARPFVPFRLQLSDGGSIDVISPELITIFQRWVIISILDRNGSERFADDWQQVWYLHITRVETLQPGAPPANVPPASPGSPAGAPV
jgi:hypothetical protein